MDNILRDGTQIDQTVFKDLDLRETSSPAVSDFIVVPVTLLQAQIAEK
jgi:hypothetical protein